MYTINISNTELVTNNCLGWETAVTLNIAVE